MAQAARLSLRMQKELKLLLSDPPPRASFPSLSAAAADLSSSSSLTAIDAEIQGPEGTVYSGGVFKIRIQIPDRYPFQPPLVTFATPIYHPNIDNGGRICLDILNLPPKGAWQPSLNISTVITSIGLLLSEPNPDDGLMCEASREFKYNRQAFDLKARTMTEKYAKASSGTVSCSNQGTKQTGEHGLTDNIEVACIVNTSEPLGMCKKLSLDPSISHCKKVDDRKVNVVSDPVLYTLESKRKSETGDSNPKLKGIDEVHKMGGSYLSKKQKLSLKLPSQPRQSECDNENCPVDQQVPSHSVPTKIQTFNGSNSQMSQVSKCNKQDSDTDPACQGRVSLTYENCKRNAGSKKLSSGHSAMSRNHEKCGNGNLIPVRNHEKCDKPEFANGDVIELHGHEQDNFKRHSQPLSLSEPKSCSRPHQRGCTEKYQTSKDHSDAAQPDSPLTVIVLDSDESDQEEERISCRRSKLSLLSKRPSLGTTKEHKALAGANK